MGRKMYITVWISSLKNIEGERKSQLITDSKYTSGIRDLSFKLCCTFLGRCCLRLETRIIIKILTYPCCPTNVD